MVGLVSYLFVELELFGWRLVAESRQNASSSDALVYKRVSGPVEAVCVCDINPRESRKAPI